MSSASWSGSTTGRRVSWYAWFLPVCTMVGSSSPGSGVDSV